MQPHPAVLSPNSCRAAGAILVNHIVERDVQGFLTIRGELRSL